MRLSMVALAAAAMLGFAGSALAADPPFILYNQTGYRIDGIYLRELNTSDWSVSVMEKGVVLDRGTMIPLSLSGESHPCHWDVKVSYTDDDGTAVWPDLNLCKGGTISLYYDRKKNLTRASID